MKKAVFLAMTLLCLCWFACGAFAQPNPVIVETPTLKVIVDGKQLNLTNIPINCNGRVLLGLREVLVALGVENDDEHIVWNPVDKSIKVIDDGIEINLAIGNKKATVNGTEIELDAEPVIHKDRTYIPTRFVAQSLSRLVFWDSSAYSVVITSEDMLMQVSSIMNSSQELIIERPVHLIQDDVLKVSGDETRYTYDIKSDSNKNTEYVYLTQNINGKTIQTEIYDDGVNLYSKSFSRDKWLKEKRPDETEIEEQDEETMVAFIASLALKEKSDQRIVIEGESPAFALDGPFDVLKDNTSKCHVTMQYRVSAGENNTEKIQLENVETRVTGTRSTQEGLKPYEFTRNIKYMLDETGVTIPIPVDLNNSYTIPEGTNEYYNKKGYTLYVPKSWYLPFSDDEIPVVSYEDETDSNKCCAIIVEMEFSPLDFSWSIYDFKPEIIKNVENSVNNCEIIGSEDFKWKGYDAIRITASGQNILDGSYVKQQVVAINYNGILVVFTYIGEPSTFDSKLNEANQIIDSWNLPTFG